MLLHQIQALERHHVVQSGKGRQTLVFAHGLGGDQRLWRQVAPAFEPTHRVLRFDLAGCGQAQPAAYSARRHAQLSGYVDDLLALAEALDWQDIVFVGHGISAMLGLLAAIAAPHHFARLVLVGASPRLLDDPPGYHGGFTAADLERLAILIGHEDAGLVQTLARTLVGASAEPRHVAELAACLAACRPEVRRRMATASFAADLRDRLAQLTVPALVLQGELDTMAPRVVGDFCHQQLRQGTLALLPGCGHYPQLTHAPAMVEAIRHYLAQPAPAAG